MENTIRCKIESSVEPEKFEHSDQGESTDVSYNPTSSVYFSSEDDYDVEIQDKLKSKKPSCKRGRKRGRKRGLPLKSPTKKKQPVVVELGKALPKAPKGSCCCICSNPQQVFSWFGLIGCMNCYLFLTRIIKLGNQYTCTEKGQCTIQWQPGSRIKCKGCRYEKILGHPNFKPPRAAPDTSVALLPVLYDNKNSEDDSKPDFGNTKFRFSRWLYADFECFKPNSLKMKKSEDEVKPRVDQVRARPNNHIDDLHITLLTYRIELEDNNLPDIDEVTTHLLEIVPSDKLLEAHVSTLDDVNEVSSSQEISKDDDSNGDAMLTFKFKSIHTTIDRRPMIKRLDLNRKKSPDKTHNDGGHPSLIAPGEECDDSDEYVIPEIDCDNM